MTLLSACMAMPLPIYEKPPFWSDPAALHFLHEGVTTRAEVEAALGVPAVRRADDRVWAYAEAQTRGAIVGGGGGPLVAEHLLLIAFDAHGVVIGRGIFQDSHGCMRTGICFASHWGPYTDQVPKSGMGGSPQLTAIDFYAISLGAESERRESFEPQVGICRLFL
ncbi:MAG: hypothetical protein R3E86_10675 [Pseudomonadales bacterium]